MALAILCLPLAKRTIDVTHTQDKKNGRERVTGTKLILRGFALIEFPALDVINPSNQYNYAQKKTEGTNTESIYTHKNPDG